MVHCATDPHLHACDEVPVSHTVDAVALHVFQSAPRPQPHVPPAEQSGASPPPVHARLPPHWQWSETQEFDLVSQTVVPHLHVPLTHFGFIPEQGSAVPHLHAVLPLHVSAVFGSQVPFPHLQVWVPVVWSQVGFGATHAWLAPHQQIPLAQASAVVVRQ